MKYRILFKDRPDPELIKEIASKHYRDIEGIGGLYDQLIEKSSCDGEEAAEIYYVAYTLALRDLELILVRVN